MIKLERFNDHDKDGSATFSFEITILKFSVIVRSALAYSHNPHQAVQLLYDTFGASSANLNIIKRQWYTGISNRGIILAIAYYNIIL